MRLRYPASILGCRAASRLRTSCVSNLTAIALYSVTASPKTFASKCLPKSSKASSARRKLDSAAPMFLLSLVENFDTAKRDRADIGQHFINPFQTLCNNSLVCFAFRHHIMNLIDLTAKDGFDPAAFKWCQVAGATQNIKVVLISECLIHTIDALTPDDVYG